MNKPASVFTNLPKVGIRPTIDGRLGGVRESLETQTMDQAKLAAALISSTLRYPNGEPVQCVIADTCIGGVAEASACGCNGDEDKGSFSGLLSNLFLGGLSLATLLAFGKQRS